MTEPHQHAVFLVAIAVAAIGAVLDWRKGEIPNWLTLPALALAPFLHVARYRLAKETTENALYEGAFSLGGAALCAVVPLLLFRQSAMGGGDVKLFVTLGAILQPVLGVEAQMYGFFAGAILAPARLAYEGKLLSTVRNSFSIGANFFLPKSRQRSVDSAALSWFRLGPAILLGVIFTAYLHW
ncbi:MAG: prepilin peptidase [Labilithrix sp.]|nr:prepilin peptidase [Labilithrix sp.]MBX3216859.1 prepilin peptidase [Labilithrix sp.]